MATENRKHLPTYNDRTVSALNTFVHQRPGLEPGNYFQDDILSGWHDAEGRRAYRAEARSITRDLTEARQLLRHVQWRTFTAAQWSEAFRSGYSGRLSWDGRTLDYCTGQYWPTEYRRAVCAVVSQLLWHDYRDKTSGCTGDTIRAYFRRVFGRGLAGRWFN